MSVLERSLQTVVCVKRKPDQYPRTTVSVDVLHQMTGCPENSGGTKRQVSYIPEHQISRILERLKLILENKRVGGTKRN